MMILPIDHRDVDGGIAQRFRGLETAESGADDHHAWSAGIGHGKLLGTRFGPEASGKDSPAPARISLHSFWRSSDAPPCRLAPARWHAGGGRVRANRLVG